MKRARPLKIGQPAQAKKFVTESLGFEPRSSGSKPEGIVRYHTTP